MIQLITLPYSTSALEPIIDQATVEIHHGKHHATYVNNINTILADYPAMADMTVEQILLSLDQFPTDKQQAVINNAGQVYNHDLYWNSLSPVGTAHTYTPEFSKALDVFESFENFKNLWKQAGLTQFGSGWVWLCVDNEGNLSIEKTLNGDTPLLRGKNPILTMDVWEHAYYLNYQNKRAEYIDKFFDIINWTAVSQKYSALVNK
jgi:superoxide dismutase, Fe-Mn family